MNQNTPVVITAQGINSNTWVKLATLLPSVKVLKTLAGTDNTLNASEFFGVNINNMTTAEYALAKQKNADIKTDEDRKGAILNMLAEKQMDMASTLNLLLNDLNFNLPAGSANTLDLMMDSNEGESYITLLKDFGSAGGSGHGQNLLIDSALAIEADSSQARVNNLALTGTYFIRSLYTLFVLEIKQNGTGILHTRDTFNRNMRISDQKSNVTDVSFTWIRKANKLDISFAAPIFYGKSAYLPMNLNQWWNWNTVYCTNSGELCDINVQSITLTLISQNDISTLAKASINAYALTPTGGKFDLSVDEYSSMENMASFYTPMVSDLVGKEWYINNGRYIFNQDLTVSYTNLQTKITESLSWKIENNRILINSGNTQIWLRSRAEAGFKYFKLDHVSGKSDEFSSGDMVYRSPVNMTEADWLGRWIEFGDSEPWGQFDFYKNNVWRETLGPQLRDAWKLLSPTSSMSSPSDESKTERDVISIVNNHFYMNVCESVEQLDFSYYSCHMESLTKNEAYNERSFGAIWKTSLFQDVNNRIWDFNNSELNLYGATSVTSQYVSKLSNNKIYLREENKILEMLSSTDQSIEVCEYPVSENCKTSGKKYTLTTGIDIKFPAYGANGWVYLMGYNNVLGSSGLPVTGMKTVAKNASIQLSINPKTGYKIENVSGCDAKVSTGTDYWGNPYYEIPARTTNCELKVDFVPL